MSGETGASLTSSAILNNEIVPLKRKYLILTQIATYLFSLRSNSTPTGCGPLDTPFL